MINHEKKYGILLLLLLSWGLYACSNHEDYLEEALEMADSNRVELEKVLSHYKNDSLKYEAACFLIENMGYHSSFSGSRLKKYLKYYECISGRRYEISKIKDSLDRVNGPFSIRELKRQSDIHIIGSKYLIHNIDWAFKVWREQPWGRNVNFRSFCEYILPYRVGDEVPAYWREELYRIYNPVLDSVRSLPQADDPLIVAKIMLDTLVKKPVTFTGKLPYGPHIGPEIIKWRSGTCRDLGDIVTYVLRAVGIPCAVDYMSRGDNNANHSWNVVADKDKHEYMIEFPKVLFRCVEKYKSPKGKVYRETFSLNRDNLKRMNRDSRFIHPTFRIPLFIDVTSHYAGKWNRNLSFSKDKLYQECAHKDLIYLCTSRRLDWLPIAWTLAGRDSIRFTDVEGGIVCRLATWNEGKLNLCTDPFLVDKEIGEMHFFISEAQLDTVCLFYKFPLYDEPYINRMRGGVFEGSNYNSFKNSDTLYLIQDLPYRLYSTIYLDSERKKKYRYVRYKGGESSFCDVSEIEFYDADCDSSSLKGTVIGTPGCWQGNGSHEYTNAFDGDPYTSFDYKFPSTGWTGLDLGTSHAIRKIRYVPRNRDNFIHKGDKYELFYWKDKKWNSAGIQEAKADSLLFVVPQNSLLYLQDHTRGKDERIFECISKKQKFW